MRIVHFLSSGSLTGPAEYILNLLKSLKEQGCDVMYIPDSRRPDGNIYGYLEKWGIPTDKRFTMSMKSKPWNTLADLFRLREYRLKGRFDIYHANFSHDHYLNLIAQKLSPPQNSRIIRTIHSERVLQRKGLSRTLLKKTDGLVTVCQSFYRKLLKEAPDLEERAIVIQGMVDPDFFQPEKSGAAIRQAFGISSETLLIGIVSRIKADRRHKDLIDILAEVVQHRQNVKLGIIGRGEFQAELQQYVSDRGMAPFVVFMGYHKEDLAEVYNALDIKVILVEGNDATARAVLEAMACQKPVVGTDRTGISDAILEGVTGFLVPENDKPGFVEKLIRLIDNADLRKNMGEQARIRVLQFFQIARQGERLREFYQKILALPPL